MKPSRIYGLFAIIGLGLAVLPGPAVGQQKSLKDQLVGPWTFLSSVNTNKDGTKTEPWGQNPKGLAIFAANGRVSLMVSRSDIPKFASNNRTQGTAEENKAVVQGIIVYIGTWSVDEASKTLTIDIDASSFPNDNGSRWKRSITSLTDDEVRWTNQNSSSGTVIEAAWKRVK